MTAALALSLSACGGGGNDGYVTIGVSIGGGSYAESDVVAGGDLSIAIRAGQSVALDAGEPVVWTLYVANSAVSGGALVRYAGVDIVATTLSQSAVGIETHASGPLFNAVPISLVAISTIDSALVATVDILITN